MVVLIGRVPTVQVVGGQHLTYTRIAINNCVVLMTIVISGKIRNIFSWIIYLYNSILFGILFSISTDMYGVDYAVVHSFIHGPIEVMGLTIGLAVGCEKYTRKQFVSLTVLAIVLIMFAAMIEAYVQRI